MALYFVSNPQHPFYESDTFQKILNFAQKYPLIIQLSEKNAKLKMSIKDVKNIQEAKTWLDKILTI